MKPIDMQSRIFFRVRVFKSLCYINFKLLQENRTRPEGTARVHVLLTEFIEISYFALRYCVVSEMVFYCSTASRMYGNHG